MNKMLRMLLVLGFLAGIVAVGMRGTAWADRLGAAGVAPAAGGLAQPVQPERPQGTTGPLTPPTGIIPVTGDALILGSCVDIRVQSVPTPPPANVYTGFVVPEEVLPKELPGNLTSCAVKVEAKPGTTLAADVKVCWALSPTTAGDPYYWDGSKWVKIELVVTDNQACVIVPASAGNPAYTALFSVP